MATANGRPDVRVRSLRTAPLGAVALVARAELRTRWRALIGFGLLLGLVGGVVLGAIAVADRTSSAYERLAAASGLPDAQVLLPAVHTSVFDAVPTMPGVVASWTPSVWQALVSIPGKPNTPKRFAYVKGGGAHPAGLVEPIVLRGREPRPDAVNEVLVNEGIADELGLRVGDEIVLRMLLPDQVALLSQEFVDPDGGFARMTVVGVARAPAKPDPTTMVVSDAFVQVYAADVVWRMVYARLGSLDPSVLAAFTAALAQATAADPARSPLDFAWRPEPQFPTVGLDPTMRAAQLVMLVGLTVFGIVVGLGGVLVVAQGLMRHHGARRPAQRVERALGLTVAERATARVLAGALGAVVAGVVGAAIALAAGVIGPLGNQRRFEPTPGFRAPWATALLGGVGLAVLFLAMTAGAAAVVATRRPTVTPLPSPGFTTIGRLPPAVLCGLGLAWRGPRAVGGVRTTATVVGLALAVTGIVATVTIGASMQRLVDDPQRFGRNADLVLLDARKVDVDELVSDRRVAALDVVTSGQVLLGDDTGPVQLKAVEHRKGSLPVETVAGRPAATPGEIALEPRTAQRLGLGVGETVVARPAVGQPVPLLITGVVVFRGDVDDPLGEGGLVVPAQLPALARGTSSTVTTYVLATPGRAGFLFQEISTRLTVVRNVPPPAILNLEGLLPLPRVLAIVLALVGGAAVVHTLLAAGRRHGGDLAVMAVLGATPRQVRATLAVAAVATVLPALLVGLPIGLGLGRVVWWEVATSTGVGGDVNVPVVALAAVVVVLLAGALLATLVPAARAVRTPPAAALAGE